MSEVIEWLNANNGFMMGVLTAVYVVATIGIALTARESNKLSRKNIEILTQLEKERSRPYIVGEVYWDIPCYFVRFTNFGKTSALNRASPRTRVFFKIQMYAIRLNTRKVLEAICFHRGCLFSGLGLGFCPVLGRFA